MYWFIIFGTIFLFLAVSGTIAYLRDPDSDYGFVAFSIGGILAVGLIIAALTLTNRDTRFNAFIEDYKNTVALVETYDGTDYGNMPALTEKIIHINTDIAKHKMHSKSHWTGWWYSSEIGNLEPITFKLSNNRNL